jgi:tRNA(Arg) A34 adenosine deaminase TadA
MPIRQQDYEKVAALLRKKSGERDVAVLALDADSDEVLVYYTSGDTGLVSPIPRSPIVDLIQELNERDQPYYGALRINNRIYHTGATTKMDTEMAALNNVVLTKVNRRPYDGDLEDFGVINVVAVSERFPEGRWAMYSPLADFRVSPIGPDPGVAVGSAAPEQEPVESLYMLATYSLVAGRIAALKSEGKGNIGAILVSRLGKLLGWGLKDQTRNSTDHAEVNCLQSYWWWNHLPVPDGARLYTTLKPCRMCAGMIKHFGRDQVKVIYGQEDYGPDAEKTVLKTGRDAWLLGSGGISSPIQLEVPEIGRRAMSELLHQVRKAYSDRPIATALASEEAESLILDAALLLERELDRYSPRGVSQMTSINTSVFRVIDHLGPFLRTRGVIALL